MTMVAYRGRPALNEQGRPPGWAGNWMWPNSQSARTALSIAVNSIFELARISMPITRMVNAPLRIWNVIAAFQQRDYLQIIFNVVAFSALVLPSGRLIAVVIDLTSEAINAIVNQPYPPPPVTPRLRKGLDPKVRENALKILGLTAKEAKNPTRLTAKFELIIDGLSKSQGRLFGPLADQFQYMMNDAYIAYLVLYPIPLLAPKS